MDSFLAELYGTNEPTNEDFEKVAHLDFLQKVAEEEGINLDELSDEDLEELAGIAAEALEDGEEEGEEYADEEEYADDDLEKEAEAKVEEADFLGRVMAHSFNQELDGIEMEKDAGRRMLAVKGVAREAKGRMGRAFKGRSPRALLEPSTRMGRARAAAGMAGKKADRLARRLGKRLGGSTTKSELRASLRGAKPMRSGKTRAQRAKSMAKDVATFGPHRRVAKGVMGARGRAAASQRRRGYGTMGGAAALLGGGAAYGGREKNSADEMWEDAIQARAWEHLMAAGLADEQGNYIPAEELDKTAGTDDGDFEVDAAALELLEAEGYPVEWY